MEMHQVRYFLAVARLLNFTRAAEACNVTQPSLTRAVQKLEEELGGALFHRERANTQLTALGRQMQPHLAQIHAAAEAARSAAQDFSKGCGGLLTLGIATSVESPDLHRALADFAEALPEIEIALRYGTSDALMQEMLEGTLDLAIVARGAEAPERVEFWRLFRRRLCVVTRISHRLANRAEVGLADLSDEVLIHCNDDGTALLERTAARHGRVPDFRHSVLSFDHARGLISAGMGSAVLPALDLLPAQLSQVPFDDSLPALDIGLAAVAGRRRAPMADRFLRAARARHWRDL